MIVITGASRGIGQFLYSHYRNQGLQVAGTYFHTAPDTDDPDMHQLDINNAAQVKAFGERVSEHASQLILINCAGSNYNAFAHKADPLAWSQLVSVNLNGTFNCINAFLPRMRQQQYGRIINFSSIVAQRGVPGTSAYAASKSGLWGMTKAIAVENASKGVTINCLNLGYFDIGMIDDVPEALLATIVESIPMKRLGDPSDILRAVQFLIDTAYITGTAIDINGGHY